MNECGCGNPEGTNKECERCRLIATIIELADCLRSLHDLQNGPPLIKHEFDWRATMQQTIRLLTRIGK